MAHNFRLPQPKQLQKLYKCLCIFVLPWLFVFFDTLQLHPLTNWFLCSFLSKWRHHTQNIMLFSWSCLSHMRPSTQSLLNRLLLESNAAGSLLFDASWISLSNGVTAEEVATEHFMNPNCSRFVFLSAESSLCVAMFARCPSSQLMTLVIAKNEARKREFSC